MCCNDSGPGGNVELKFDEIKMKINNATLKFDPEYHNGEFRIFDKGNSANENYNSPELDALKIRIDQIQKDNDYKKDKITELNEKIKEIEDKLNIMRKILNIDVSEQEYLKELTDKLKEQNPENKGIGRASCRERV